MTSKPKILAALRGAQPESEPIELAAGVQVTLRVVPAARKEALRLEANREVPADEDGREERVVGLVIIRILAAALEHHGLSLDEVRAERGAPVLRRLWGEYERLEALVAPATDDELDTLHAEVKALVGESRAAAATHLSGLGYTTLLHYAISTVGRPSS